MKKKNTRMVRQRKWSVYIAQCRDGSLYTGITLDIERRLAEHSSGKGSRYVRSKLPVRLVYKEFCKNRSEALKREAGIKRLSHPEKLVLVKNSRKTCQWPGNDPLMLKYHNEEWGMPLYDDKRIFEFLILEGMQAGLSWRTVLHKRENFRKAFDGFDPEKVARYGAVKVKRLMSDAGIIRNRAKIESAVTNAKNFLKLQQKYKGFQRYMWDFVGGKPIVNRWKTLKELPAKSRESDAMSASLKENGFRFVGSTICYAHMQATGMVNDHIVSCFRHSEICRG